MKLYEKRWQVVIAVLTHVLPVFDNLRQAWDGDKFSLADSVTSALSSSLFCRYIWMIHLVHKLLSNFELWLESCACHEHLLDGVPRKHKRSAQAKFFAKLPSSNCPMRGKRAAELAAGVLEKTLRNMEQLAFQSFLESDAEDAALSQADRAIMLKDLEYAKAYLHFGLTTKLSFWRKLPWRLCALAHHWQTESRAAARACMQEFDEFLQQPGLTLRHHHPVSVQFLAADSSLRAALQVHADGGDMSPDLLVAVAQLKFIPCVERVVEGLHRDVKIAAKHIQLGPTKVSLSVRLREIKALCDDDQECLPDLTRHFDDMRHLKKAAALLGVLHHPSILQLLLEKNSDASEWWKVMQHVVHRCQLDQQFAENKEARARHDKKRGREEKERKALRGHGSLAIPNSFEGILKRCICDRFKKQAGASNFFTLPSLQNMPNGNQLELVPVQSEPVPKKPRAGDESEAPAIHFEPDEEPEVDGQGASHMAFRVLHGQPSRLKLAPQPLAAAPVFQSDACIVTLHGVVHENRDGPSVNVSARTVPHVLCNLEKCSLDVLRADFKEWQLSEEVSYTLPCADICDADTLDLILRLEAAGWSWGRMPQKQTDRAALIYKQGSPKTWYSLSHAINSTYLRCLLNAEEIFQHGIFDAIPHWTKQPAKVYKAILQGQQFALGQPALESDVVVDGSVPALPDQSPADVLAAGGLEVPDGADADEQDQLLQELIELQLQLPEDEQQEEEHPAAGVAFSDSDNESLHSGGGRVPDREIEPDVGDPPPPVQPPRVDPPRPPSPQPAEEDDVASVDSEITKPSRWGVFRITPKQPGKGRPHGGYEASCPFHKKSASTGCKKYLQLRDGSAAEKAKALLALQHR